MISSREVLDISILIPALNEEENIAQLIPRVKKVVEKLTPKFEVVVIDGGSTDRTKEVAIQSGARIILQSKPGYGVALKQGFESSSGEYIITIDADLSHDPIIIKDMIKRRNEAELIIASRFIGGGSIDANWIRKVLSIILNRFFYLLLSLNIKDVTSGFRLYHRKAIEELSITSTDFDVQLETAIKIACNGWRVKEIPFEYKHRKFGQSKARLFKFGISFLKTFFKMYRLRNSVLSADYDDRAYNSKILLQRIWQRTRYKILMSFVGKNKSGMVLDIGCGSSQTAGDFTRFIGLDIDIKKLRYLKYTKLLDKYYVNATLEALPFKNDVFDTIICSEVIEHIPKSEILVKNMYQVLKPSGLLILGTPDYGRPIWPFIEKIYKKLLPNAYADQHISHYTFNEVSKELQNTGFQILEHKYLFGSIMVFKAMKK